MKKLYCIVSHAEYFKKYFLLMKLAIIFIFITSFHAAAINGYTQRLINLTAEKQSLTKILEKVESNYGYRFVYDEGLKLEKINISVYAKNATIDEFMDTVLNKTVFGYKKINNGLVVIIGNPNVNQALPISGKIVDIEGKPLSGVSVIEKGTTNGVTTADDGSFSIVVKDNNAVLLISNIGYELREISINKDNYTQITLSAIENRLDEIVVVGYGTQRKENLTGSVSSVNNRILKDRPTTNVLDALQGSASGLQITKNNGQPGKEGFSVLVRGFSSVNGSNPLYIVDGTPVESIFNINTNDIESISVLKDAAASAIYGARAAGGVILITTKAGKVGKVQINFSSLYGFQKILNMPKVVHSWQDAKMQNEAYINAGLTQYWRDEEVEWMKDPNIEYKVNPANPAYYVYYYDIDPSKAVVRQTSPTQNHNISIQGGNDKSKYYISLGYFKQYGIFKLGPDNSSRYNARLNYNNRLSKIFSLDTKLSYDQRNTLSPIAGDLFYRLAKIRTNNPIYLPESDSTKYAYTDAITYAQLKDGGKNDERAHQFMGVFELKAANVIKGLDLRAIFSPTAIFNINNYISRTIPMWIRTGIATNLNYPNQIIKGRNNVFNTSLQYLADYNFRINSKNIFHFLGGYTYENYRYDGVSSIGKNLISNDLFSLNLGDVKQAQNSDNIQTWAMQSLLSRLNYTFDNKYLVELNLRYDGSSKLAPQHRYQLFPSMSLAWKLDREEWFKNTLGFFNEFKLRGSWGQLGNSNGVIGNYDYLSLINSGSLYPFNGERNISLYQNFLASPEKKWETITTTNLGLDISTLSNRLRFTADYFNKYNKDMLVPVSAPDFIGINSTPMNLAEMKTTGWELSMGWKDEINKYSNYWVNINLSDYVSKVTKYAGRNLVAAGNNFIIEGKPLNSIYGYLVDGMFQTVNQVKEHAYQNNLTGAGDLIYRDINGDKKITPGNGRIDDHGDLVYLGNPDPHYMYGADLGFIYKNFDFSAFIQGVGKRNILIDPGAVLPFLESWVNAWDINLDYWTPENPNAKFPRLYKGGYHNTLVSSKWVLNAAYTRLKNLQVGYTLPSHLIKNVKCRVFFSGQNLWEISKMWIKYYDPENAYNSSYVYPFFRTYTFGVNLNF